MKIIVWGNDEQVVALKKGSININWIRLSNPTAWVDYPDACAFFDLSGMISDYGNTYPVFVNKVHESLPQQANLIRMNGWPGFIENDTWEITGKIDQAVIDVLNALDKKYIACADEPGLISARIIAMIINEAYLAIEEDVSTEEEIDIAMKLGTNYPNGPFEWAKKIGLQPIHQLLTVLAKHDKRYTAASSINKIIANY